MAVTWRGGLVVALCVLALGGATLTACSPSGDGIDWLRRPVGAICKVNVTNVGVRQVETDYVPHVVACENGGAGTEALKAQAVAARSYMYYRVLKSGSICDGTACQVYTCGNKPKQKHYDAVKATAGQVLVWGGVVICSFYVAGAKPTTPSCQALASDPDPTSTEKYVTYNAGKSGGGITQSPLGWVGPSNKYNRGCKSQNGAHCLATRGKLYPQILRFYYGDDIQLVTAAGFCVTPSPDAAAFDAFGPPKDGAQPKLDTGPLPGQDSRPPHTLDGHLPPVQPPSDSPGSGGCAVSAGQRRAEGGLWPGVLLILLIRRRRWQPRSIIS